MTHEQLDALLAAAEKATPGPWKIARQDDAACGAIYVIRSDTRVVACAGCNDCDCHGMSDADADYIALADPDTISELIRFTRYWLSVYDPVNKNMINE